MQRSIVVEATVQIKRLLRAREKDAGELFLCRDEDKNSSSDVQEIKVP